MLTSNMTKVLLAKMKKDLRKKTQAELAREIGLPAMTISRILSGKSAGHIESWDSIARHYDKSA